MTILTRIAACSICCWLFLAVTAGTAACGEKLVSVVLTGDLERYRSVHQAFLQSLSQDQVTVYTQAPNPDPLSLANSIRKAVAIDSDLIITYGAMAAMAAKREAGTVPVLFADVYDPVSLGLSQCIDDPSCDMSGISASTPLKTLLRTMADLAPPNRTIAALYSSNDPGSALQYSLLEDLAGSQGFKIEPFDLTSVKGLDLALYQLSERQVILFISESALIQQHIDQILSFANKRRMLVISQAPGLCAKGALLTLEPELNEQGVKLADYANQVLNGTLISSLPVITPHKVDLVLNLAIAREHKLNISLQTLHRTTRVIKATQLSEQVK